MLKDRVQLIGINPVRGTLRCADQTSTTVVDEIDENFRVRSGLKSGSVRVVTKENVKEVLLVDSSPSVVDLVFLIDVGNIDFSL